MKKKLFSLIPAAVIFASFLIWLFNYFALQENMNTVINSDYRNRGIDVSVHYGTYADLGTLVYNLTGVPRSKSPNDIFRVFLQFAEKMKDKKFSVVKLEFKGELKFILDGDDFRVLGREYSSQNPAYIIRTFPAKLRNPDDTSAYSEWSGGLLGVLSRQMQDYNNFHHKWYIDDL